MVNQGSSIIILKRDQTGGTCGFQQTNNGISSTRGHPSRKTWRSQTKCQSGSSRWDCSWWRYQGRPCSHGQGAGSCQQRGPTGIYATQHRRLKHGRKNSTNLSSQDDYPGGILEAKSTKPGYSREPP